MGRLRVLMLGWEFPPRITGGLGVACAGLAGALRARVDLTLRLPEDETGDPYATGEGYDGDLWRRVRAFADRAAPGDFDLIHAHDWLTVPAASELSRRTGLPIVLHLHSLELDRSGERNRIFLVERAGMRMARRVITVSNYTAGRCEHEYGIPRSKIRPVPNGVSARYGGSPGERRSRRVVFIGRMTPQKAPEDFLRMARGVAERVVDAEFVMAGTGEMLDPLKRLAAAMGLEGRIRFPGFLTRNQVMAELSTSAVLCLPSRSEPFGLVALEAAAHGVPAVVTDRCGVAEVLPSARVVPVGDVRAMTSEVASLLVDPVLRGSLGRQARMEAEAASWERAAERVVEVYREVVSPSG